MDKFAGMKRYMLTLTLLPALSYGQTSEPDTIPAAELGEITVIADMQHTDAAMTVYIPTTRQKEAAADAASLLSRMNIPQLNVNPISETIRTADNQDIDLFINYQPASQEDLKGLRPADVKKVEYLDFPTDPRFLRARHVVNLITRRYAYGGYTKLSGNEHLMIKTGETSVYSKFAYREFEYDLMSSADHDSSTRIGSVSDETYRLQSGTVRRESGTESGRYRRHGLFSALRASWDKSDNLSFRNLISYRRIRTPQFISSGYVRFSSLYPSATYRSESPSASNALGWNGELYAVLGRGWSANGNFNAELINNTTTSNYAAGAELIDNYADENSWNLRGDIQVNKSLSDKVTLFSSLSSAGGRTRIHYNGSSNAVNRFRQTFLGVYLGISMNLRKLSATIDGGYAWETNSINGLRADDTYPFTHINIQYSPDSHNSISLWGQYATFSPDAAMKNPNTIRQSELLYISGNPDLRSSRNISVGVSYTWLPDNKWQMSAYANLFRISGRQIEVYTPDGPDGAMMRHYRNDGNYNHGQIGARVVRKFFDGKLAISATPRWLLYHTTGNNSISHFPFTASLSADHYIGNFFFSAYWASRWSYVDGETSFLRYIPSEYSIGAGWTAGGWNITLSAVNLFRSSWQTSRDYLHTGSYDCTSIQFGNEYHRRISVKITYTFNYGRKVTPSAELCPGSDISSSILH